VNLSNVLIKEQTKQATSRHQQMMNYSDMMVATPTPSAQQHASASLWQLSSDLASVQATADKLTQLLEAKGQLVTDEDAGVLVILEIGDIKDKLQRYRERLDDWSKPDSAASQAEIDGFHKKLVAAQQAYEDERQSLVAELADMG
jgi:hypothetical protein